MNTVFYDIKACLLSYDKYIQDRRLSELSKDDYNNLVEYPKKAAQPMH